MNIGISSQEQINRTLTTPSTLPGAINNLQGIRKDTLSCIMYIFTPRILPNQIVRPYVYAFNDRSVSAFADALDTIESGGLNSTKFNRNLDLQNAILPDSNGIALNMADINTKYTFAIFVIDQHAPTALGAPQQVNIYNGYFTDEPISSYGVGQPTYNLTAAMIVTHQSSLSNFGRLNMGVDSMAPLSNALLLSQAQSQLVEVPTDTLVANIPSTAVGESATKDVVVDGPYLQDLSSSICLSSCLQNPKTQLRMIGNAIKQGIDTTNFSDPCVTEMSGEFGAGQPSELFNRKLVSSLRSRETDVINMNSSLRVDQTILLGTFFDLYPMTKVLPCEIPAQSSWDVVPQAAISPQTIYSAMATATINAICNSLGIATLSFGWCSYKQNSNDMLGTDDFSNWELAALNPIYTEPGNPAEQIRRIWTQFMQLMERDLMPILTTGAGHFKMSAKYDLAGETLLALRFLDFNGSNEYSGFYETSNRFGSINCPMVSNLSILSKNQESMSALTNAFLGDSINRSYASVYNSIDSPTSVDLNSGIGPNNIQW